MSMEAEYRHGLISYHEALDDLRPHRKPRPPEPILHYTVQPVWPLAILTCEWCGREYLGKTGMGYWACSEDHWLRLDKRDQYRDEHRESLYDN